MMFDKSLILKQNKKILMPCLMLKNEERRILTTLLSAKPVMDKLCILDTGSTDNTLKIIITSPNNIINSNTVAEYKYRFNIIIKFNKHFIFQFFL